MKQFLGIRFSEHGQIMVCQHPIEAKSFPSLSPEAQQVEMAESETEPNLLAHETLYTKELCTDELYREDLSQEGLSQEDLSQEDLSQEGLSQEGLSQEDLSQEDLSQNDAPLADPSFLAKSPTPISKKANGRNLLRVGSGVMVNTEHGLSFGSVVWASPNPDSLTNAPENPTSLPEQIPNARPATPDEAIQAAKNTELAGNAHEFCRHCIQDRELDMKLVDVEVVFDHSKMLFYFTAPTRIDFRDLVKDLVRKYRTRIELRQIGVRHETQMVGAVGNCGMVCCCRRYLRKFAPVTIKMAKEQNLFLNPAKISGICGRLLCCLSYEQENYDEFHRRCPRLGKRYQTTQGHMRILRANMFRNSIVVLPDNEPEREITLDEWATLQPQRPSGNPNSAQNPPAVKNAPPPLMVSISGPEILEDSDDAQSLQSPDNMDALKDLEKN